MSLAAFVAMMDLWFTRIFMIIIIVLHCRLSISNTRVLFINYIKCFKTFSWPHLTNVLQGKTRKRRWWLFWCGGSFNYNVSAEGYLDCSMPNLQTCLSRVIIFDSFAQDLPPVLPTFCPSGTLHFHLPFGMQKDLVLRIVLVFQHSDWQLSRVFV